MAQYFIDFCFASILIFAQSHENGLVALDSFPENVESKIDLFGVWEIQSQTPQKWDSEKWDSETRKKLDQIRLTEATPSHDSSLVKVRKGSRGELHLGWLEWVQADEKYQFQSYQCEVGRVGNCDIVFLKKKGKPSSWARVKFDDNGELQLFLPKFERFKRLVDQNEVKGLVTALPDIKVEVDGIDGKKRISETKNRFEVSVDFKSLATYFSSNPNWEDCFELDPVLRLRRR